jgi:hypothetical protein
MIWKRFLTVLVAICVLTGQFVCASHAPHPSAEMQHENMAMPMGTVDGISGSESDSCCENNCCCHEANLLLGIVSDITSWTLSGSHPLHMVSWVIPMTVVPELSTPPPKINPQV